MPRPRKWLNDAERVAAHSKSQLTKQQKAFVLKVVQGISPLQAAIDLGAKYNTAKAYAYRTLLLPKIKEAIAAWYFVLGWDGAESMWKRKALESMATVEGKDIAPMLKVVGESVGMLGNIRRPAERVIEGSWVEMGELPEGHDELPAD